MSKYFYQILDGHGSLDESGEYVTAGKRSPELPDGRRVYEGVINQDIVEKLAAMLVNEGIDYKIITPGHKDFSLKERSTMANNVYKLHPNSILISVHCNAAGDGESFNDANGIGSYFYQDGDKYSKYGKLLAYFLQEELIKATGLRDRGIRGRNFHILRETYMPAVLSECGFMTNLDEAKLLLDDSFRLKLAQAHFNFIKRCETGEVIG